MEERTSRSSRRRVLAWGSLGIFAALAGYWGRRSGTTRSTATAPTDSLTAPEKATEAVTLDASTVAKPNHELYSPLVNTEFTIEIPEAGSETVRLVEVTPVTVLPAPKAEYSSFSLYFEARDGTLPEGGICRVTHPDLNAMDLFLSPVGRAKDGRILLQAAFTERV